MEAGMLKHAFAPCDIDDGDGARCLEQQAVALHPHVQVGTWIIRNPPNLLELGFKGASAQAGEEEEEDGRPPRVNYFVLAMWCRVCVHGDRAFC
jgi:hypothetical protein